MITEGYVKAVYDKVKDAFGLSDHYDGYPELEFGGEENWPLAGEYRDDWNSIIIYDEGLINEEQMVRTVVHEYRHYLQDPKVLNDTKLDYMDRPCEIDAYAFEENNYKKFML